MVIEWIGFTHWIWAKILGRICPKWGDELGMHTVVIGGGAAGLIAAGMAVNASHTVTLVERNNRMARKVMITGKGRCNVTNDADLDRLMAHMTRNGRFLYSAFSRFTTKDTMEFFKKLGVALKVERGGRVFSLYLIVRWIL